jgi:RHS repeat-associated protein
LRDGVAPRIIRAVSAPQGKRLALAAFVAMLTVAIAVAAPGFAAAPRRPDLTVKALSAGTPSVAPGGKLAISAKIADSGPGKAGPSTLAAYLGKGRKHSRADVKLGTLATPALRAGKSAALKGKLAVPAATAPGAYTLIACADATAKVKEKSEANDCRAGATVTVGSSGGPQPGSGGGSETRGSPAPSTGAISGGGTTPPTGGGNDTPPREEPHETPREEHELPSEEPVGGGLPGSGEPVPPPPPPPQAPPVPEDTPVPFASATNFLYEGPDPVQTGVEDEAIEPARAGVLSGRVLATDGTPLPSVTVTVLDQPELGQTVTQADGHYDLAVNSGGPIVLRFERPTFLSVEREIDPAVRNYEDVEDVVMKHFDGVVTAITPNAGTVQVAQSSISDDESGERRSTMIFNAGTTATMRLPGGTTKPLKTMHVRATEYSVGARGPEAMPGELPPTSAYTYAANYSFDEAVEAGATAVQFNQPVAVYTDNFLDIPVGTGVPLGYYDEVKAEWTPERDGRVVKIVSIVGGKAELDVDGDGQADSGAALSDLGITDEERAALAGVYGPGKELSRIQLTHFSPLDLNYAAAPPEDAEPPHLPAPKPKPRKDPKDPLPPCKEETGSAVDCDAQALREQLPIAGTPYTLDYTSDRAEARSLDTVKIPLSKGSVPASLVRIELDVEVVGRHTHLNFNPAPNLTYEYEWDGRDAFGREWVGPATATVKVSYVYPSFYRAPRAESFFNFALYPGEAIDSAGIDSAGRKEIRFSQTTEFTLEGRPISPPSGLGGWSLSAQNAVDGVDGVVALGTGDTMTAPVQDVARLLVNPQQEVPPQDTVRLRGATWQADGSIWFLEEYDTSNPTAAQVKVRKADPDGSVSTIATLPAPPGTFYNRYSIVAASDGGAWAMVAGERAPNAPIWHVAVDGTLTKVTAGEPGVNQPATPNAGDGLPASQVVIDEPEELITGPDGSLYIGGAQKRLQHVTAAGDLRTVFEDGVLPERLFEGHVDNDFAYAPDGSLYVLQFNLVGHQVVNRYFPSGKMQTVLGGSDATCCTTGQAADMVNYTFGGPITISPDGDLVFSNSGRIFEVEADGRVRQLAGASPPDVFELNDNVPALGQELVVTGPFDIAPDGRIAAATLQQGLREIEPGIPGYALGGYSIPSSDGGEVYRFDSSNLHTKTVDALTGATLEQFGYDAEGELSSVTDRDGRTTTIERDSNGDPTAIVAPTGERTAVSLDGEGNLASVTRPGLPATQLHYEPGGLLTEEIDAAGGVHKFTYDTDGYVTSDTDPDGVKSTITDSEEGGDRTLTVTSPLGRATKYANGGDPTTGFDRTVTTPSGAKTVTKVGPDGSASGTFPDGSINTSTVGPDPRFGGLGRFTKEATTKEPSGLILELARTRSTTLADPTDPFSVTDFTDTYRLDSGPPATSHYDGPTRTMTLTEPSGRKGVAKFDAKGHEVFFQEDLAETPTTATVNGAGLVTRTEQGTATHEYAYDSHDRLATATDPLGHASHYEYDASGRLTSAELPGGEKYHFEYDPLEHLTGVTAPSGAAARLSFTPGGRVHGFIPPGSGDGYLNAYDADGLLESTTLPGGRKISYGRDAGGRVASIGYPEATVGVGYVGNGQQVASLTRTPNGGGTAEGLQMGYDGGLLTTSQWTGAGADGYSFQYGSTLQVAQAKATAGAASATTAITHNEDGLVTHEGPFTMRRSGPDGAITELSGGPLQTSQTWDALGHLGSRTDTVNGSQAFKMVLTRDAAGRLTQKVETVAGSTHTYTYEYDVDNRLTGVRRDGTQVEHYAYDLDSNRTTREVEGASKTATYDAAGLITGLGGTAYTTDSDGFVVTSGGDTFTYAARGELLSATVGGTTETYAYDGFGRLVARTVGANTWRYLYGNPEQQLQVTAAVEPDGTLDTLSYTDTGYLYSILRGAIRYYVSTDQVGSPRVVTDASGAVVKKVDYSAFGEVLSDSAPAFELPIGYANGIADPAAGIVHMGLRPYDPASGRFMARDPLGLGGGQANLFAYAGNEPIQHSDPLGMASLATGLCDGWCVGLKFAVTEKGLSTCVELGAGKGDEFEYSPDGGLDENKVYAKTSASLSAAGILGIEGSLESAVRDNCRGKPTNKFSYKGCAVGACVGPEGLSVDAAKILEAGTKAGDPAKLGFEAKAGVGICQQVIW